MKPDDTAVDVAPSDARICRYDLDASGKPCAEGYYAHDGRAVILIPPTGEMAPGLRLATQAEVDAAAIVLPAEVRHIANCVANPSDAGA